MDKTTLLTVHDFSHARLLGTLDAIEKIANEKSLSLPTILAWRPGPGRAHIGWQAMHCAATHDRYLHVGLLGGTPTDTNLVTNFAGGSTPSDENVPTLAMIREAIKKQYAMLRAYIEACTPEDFAIVKLMGKAERSVGESLVLLAWHEAHHQGQIHLTWNLYKAGHGVA